MTPTRWLHCTRCDVAYRGIHHVDPCWYRGCLDTVVLADGIPSHITRGAPGSYYSWSAANEEAA